MLFLLNWMLFPVPLTLSGSIRRSPPVIRPVSAVVAFLLPAEQAVWLVLMMGLLRDLSIKDVCHHLDIFLQPDEGYQHLAPSVLTAARQRLGEIFVSCLQ